MKKFLILFILLFSGFLTAEQIPFDDNYQVSIVESRGLVKSPDITSNYWRAINFITLANGIELTYTTRWMHQTQAKQVADRSYSGLVNVIHASSYGTNQNFQLLFKDKQYSLPVSIGLSSKSKFKNLPEIESITENIETVSHWFSNELKYRYVIQLRDGSKWLTEARKSPWAKPWTNGSRVILFGNSLAPCFINVDATKADDAYYINYNYYEVNLEPL